MSSKENLSKRESKRKQTQKGKYKVTDNTFVDYEKKDFKG